MFPLCIASTLLQLAPIAPPSAASGGLVESRGGCLPSQTSACLGPEEEIRLERAESAGSSMRGPCGAPSFLAPQPFTFYPLGGRRYRDAFPRYFVDLDPTGGFLDWNCTLRTYDGHNGNDVMLRSFGEQAIGVPVFAALDGVVIAADDGHPDMNTTCNGLANYVVLDHGGGRRTRYLHLRNGSVAVSVGQGVRAGEQIGLAASSGCSTWPHLHFEELLNGLRVEPNAGPCNPGVSGWTNQVPITYSLYMDDFGFALSSPLATPLPNALPRSGQWPQTQNVVYLWGVWKGMPAQSNWQITFVRPDGAVSYATPTQSFGISSYSVIFWWSWGFTIPEMQTVAGVWKVRISVNGALQIEAPLTVVPALVPGFNRTPEPISVAFDPVCPSPGDVVGCLVEADLLLDDLDWDIVRYRYLWKVDGAVVRDVVSAGRADYLAREDMWSTGQLLTCEVTPSDGSAAGPTAIARFPDVSTYCTAGTTSSGCVPSIGATGVPSASAGSGFAITVASVEGQRAGLIFYGVDNSNFTPVAWAPASSSFRCVRNPVQRTLVQLSGGTAGSCDGALGLDWNAYVASQPFALGSPFLLPREAFAQAWFRDPMAPDGSNLSDALRFVACP
jgi:murein DD-endopeptidase MepM/ murein hydrolase activator NlpD